MPAFDRKCFRPVTIQPCARIVDNIETALAVMAAGWVASEFAA